MEDEVALSNCCSLLADFHVFVGEINTWVRLLTTSMVDPFLVYFWDGYGKVMVWLYPGYLSTSMPTQEVTVTPENSKRCT